MNLIIAGIGFFYMVEGVANILYWWNDQHPWYFQVGRFIRVALGAVLTILGLQ